MSWQDLGTRSLEEVSWQGSWRHLCLRDLHKISVRDFKVRSLFKPSSLKKISEQDICSLHQVSVQDVHKRSPGKISVQDLYESFVGKISVRNLLARSVKEVSWQDSVQAPYRRGLLGHVTRAMRRENLQGKCWTPRPGPPFCASLRSRNVHG